VPSDARRSLQLQRALFQLADLLQNAVRTQEPQPESTLTSKQQKYYPETLGSEEKHESYNSDSMLSSVMKVHFVSNVSCTKRPMWRL
jgi:negative regulator of genetic competence, sporulation and motility